MRIPIRMRRRGKGMRRAGGFSSEVEVEVEGEIAAQGEIAFRLDGGGIDHRPGRRVLEAVEELRPLKPDFRSGLQPAEGDDPQLAAGADLEPADPVRLFEP